MRCLSPRLLVSFLLVFLSAFATHADDLAPLAEQLASRLQKAHKKNLLPRVVVSSFFTSEGRVSQLTEKLSADFSDLLSAKLDEHRVIRHSLLIERMKLDLLTPRDLQDRSVATWLAEKVGANTIVLGTVTLHGVTATLKISALFLSNHSPIGEWEGMLTLTPELETLSDQPLPGADTPRLLVGCDQEAGKRSKEMFHEAGVEMPKCIRCPDPSYSDEARRRKFQGTIALNVMVDEKGSAVPLNLIASASPELIDSDLVDGTLSVIRTWKFQPATKGGEPVAVCVPVEVSFRLF